MRNSKMQEVTMEIAVGSFVLVTFMIIALFAIFIGQNNLFKKSYDYEVTFPHVSGLVKGNAVHYRGLPSGQVRAMNVVQGGEGVVVSISMEFPLKLHEDYEISIKTASALGGKWLVIEEGSLDLPEISTSEILEGRSPVDIIEEATAMVQELRNTLTEENFLQDIKATVANINAITQKINTGEGLLAKLLNDGAVYTDLKAVMANLRQVSTSLTGTDSTVGKLLNQDDTLISDLSEASENLAAFSKSLNQGEGTISKLLDDDRLYNDVVDLVNEARATLDDLRETSPITTFSSIFFGAF